MKLAKIKEIKPRDVWANEATVFTPWLAEEENLALLSEAISLDLELYSREEKIDGGRADIVCLESGTARKVIIENQLEKTDPDHLCKQLGGERMQIAQSDLTDLNGVEENEYCNYRKKPCYNSR